MRQPDIEIYLKDADQQAVTAWLEQAIGPCTPWQRKGQTFKCLSGDIEVTWLPQAEPGRGHAARAIARVLMERARAGDEAPRGMLIEEIDTLPPAVHALAPFLSEAGFVSGALGFQFSARGL